MTARKEIAQPFDQAMNRMRRAMECGTGCHLTPEMVQAVTRTPSNYEMRTVRDRA